MAVMVATLSKHQVAAKGAAILRLSRINKSFMSCETLNHCMTQLAESQGVLLLSGMLSPDFYNSNDTGFALGEMHQLPGRKLTVQLICQLHLHLTEG